jgi:2-oxoglutarate dehydrogenase E2 component (dihydrolipoamide succinyltransferase)
MATKVEVPDMGESISEAVILRWMKEDGDTVAMDEPICELETDKATLDLPATAAGSLRRLKNAGDTVRVGEVVAEIGEAPAKAATPPAATPEAPAQAAPPSPAPAKPTPPRQTLPPLVPTAQRAAEPAAPARTVSTTTKEVEEPTHVVQRLATEPEPSQEAPSSAGRNGAHPAPKAAGPSRPQPSDNGIRRVPMTKIRRRIAERLVRAQHTAAMLTTFNEVDMSAVLDLRARHKEQFTQKHGVSLGLMSFFAKATVLALKQYPVLNAEIEGDDILYHDHVHLSVAVNTERGLVVPVLRDVENMSFAQFESEIKRVANAARDGKLSLQELSGGTFTITNGGVFGSLLSTPILNPPQTGILGMHTIQKRPVVVDDKIVARPMMYVALSYDHRLVDGRDAVQFLVTLKGLLEEPMKMILDV